MSGDGQGRGHRGGGAVPRASPWPGAVVTTAETAEETRAAWRALPGDIAVLILTPHAAGWLGDPPALASRPGVLVVVMPE